MPNFLFPQKNSILNGFQNFPSLPVLLYLQAVLFLKILTFYMNILPLFEIRRYQLPF